MNAGFNARGYERSAYAMVLLLALVGWIVSLPAAVRASGLECPTTATGSLSIASEVPCRSVKNHRRLRPTSQRLG